MEESYYDKNKEARKEYQKAYYEAKKGELRRKRELEGELDPKKQEKNREYQRNYYLTNRRKLLDRKRLRYNESKKA